MTSNLSKLYLRLKDNFIPKYLERFYLLDKRTDNLYELNKSAFEFVINKCKGDLFFEDYVSKNKFVKKLLNSQILEAVPIKKARKFYIKKPPLPSLRYLEIQVTDKCNLNCLHCYQGKKQDNELNFEKLKKVIKEFIKLQGVRLIISGGEPLLYSRFNELNKFIKNLPLRTVLLTNGILLNKIDVKKLNFDEIQFSLDGIEESHNFIRGKESFSKLCKSLDNIRNNTNIDISFATMVHKKNLNDFPRMKKFVKKYNAIEWSIDFPVLSGNLKENKSIIPPLELAVKAMNYRFGASYHYSDEDNIYACGLHLMTLTANGFFLQCSFYPKKVFGSIDESLFSAIINRKPVKLSQIKECEKCPSKIECRGGCRFRAGGIKNKDLVMCKAYSLFNKM